MTPELRSLPMRAMDCLKYSYKFTERGEHVTTTAMRACLGRLEPDGRLSDATITQLFKWLAEQGYVRHTPYHGIELTARGRQAAAEIVRHHRLLELYLVQLMGFALEDADAEAERLEHVISERFEERMDELLGHPTLDPHGDPIPSILGEVVVRATQPLGALRVGERAAIGRVSDDDAAILRYLRTLGIVPGAEVVVLAIAPYGDVVTLQVGARTHALGKAIAERVFVRPLGEVGELGTWDDTFHSSPALSPRPASHASGRGKRR
ncbi:MAG: metal-dependent transcriptional regulator [Ktedonobacterales bacterium]